MIHSFARTTLGRQSGGLCCIYNVNAHIFSNVFKNDKFIIFSIDKLNLIIIFVYFNFSTDVKLALQSIEDYVGRIAQKLIDPKIIFCGDFNCRIGEANEIDSANFVLDTSNFSGSRSSMDIVINVRGRQLLDYMELEDFLALNGRTRGDSPANFTFVSGVGKSVIDLAWVNQSALGIVSDLIVRTDVVSSSDHFPVELVLSRPQATSLSRLSYTSIRWLDSLKDEYTTHLNSIDLTGINLLGEHDLLEFLYDKIYSFADKYGLKKKFTRNTFCIWSDTEYRTMKSDLGKLVNSCKRNRFESLSEIALLHS